jgi:hypothetical protein
MKFYLLLLVISFINLGNAQTSTYKIITEFADAFEGDIDTSEINKLNEPLRALTALYSALAGTECDTSTCELTTALGLGSQGSEVHKSLIKKYFPADKLAKNLIIQDCYLRPGGASTFSEYAYLTITQTKDTFKVNYKVNFYDHGNDSYTKRLDVYLLRNNQFKAIHRSRTRWTSF